MTDEPRGRHLHPVEPPFDPEYDTTPNPIQIAARDAERGLLGTLLIKPENAGEILPVLDPTDFATPAHETIWNAAAEVHAAGHLPDGPALLRELAGDRIFKQAGGPRLLTDLLEAAPVFPQPEHHASIVRDGAALRRLEVALINAKRAHAEADPANIHATLEKLSDLADTAATTFGPPNTATATGFRDLSWILTGQAPQIPPPVWVQHQAGHALFYAGKVNGIFGDPETAKTWLAQAAMVEALNTGGTAAMVDVDHNGEDHTAARLILLGARPEHIADPTRFRYYDPQEGDELRNAIAEITDFKPDIVLIDSLGEIFPMLGLNTNDGDEITGGLRLISRPASTGSCVIFIDHLPKSAEARGNGFAIGSIAKKRAIRGSYIRAEERTKPAPGQIGRIGLFIEKDTAGQLRKVTPGGKYVGTFVLDSTHPHVTTWAVTRDDAPTGPDGRFRPTGRMEAVSRYIEDNDLCTFTDIKDSVEGKDATLRRAITLLQEEGFVSVIRGGRSHKHHSIALYRETEDDRRNDPQEPPDEHLL